MCGVHSARALDHYYYYFSHFRFCHEYKINQFYMTDDSIVYIKRVQKYGNDPLLCNMLELHQELIQIGSEKLLVPEPHQSQQYERHQEFQDSNVIASYSGPSKEFAIIGFRKSRNRTPQFTSPSKRHCTSFIWVNNMVLMNNNIFFEPWNAFEDLKICNDADGQKLNVVKINIFEFTKIHSRDTPTLYEWMENDFCLQECAVTQINQHKIESVLLQYLKSIRIEDKVNISELDGYEELANSINDIQCVDNGGIKLVFVKNLNFVLPKDTSQLILILPLSEELYCKYTCKEDMISEMNLPNLMEFKIESTHRPRVVLDFWIITITLDLNANENLLPSNVLPQIEIASLTEKVDKIIENQEQMKYNQEQMRYNQEQMKSEVIKICEEMREFREHHSRYFTSNQVATNTQRQDLVENQGDDHEYPKTKLPRRVSFASISESSELSEKEYSQIQDDNELETIDRNATSEINESFGFRTSDGDNELETIDRTSDGETVEDHYDSSDRSERSVDRRDVDSDLLEESDQDNNSNYGPRNNNVEQSLSQSPSAPRRRSPTQRESRSRSIHSDLLEESDQDYVENGQRNDNEEQSPPTPGTRNTREIRSRSREGRPREQRLRDDRPRGNKSQRREVCKYYSRKGECWKNDSCNFSHDIIRPTEDLQRHRGALRISGSRDRSYPKSPNDRIRRRSGNVGSSDRSDRYRRTEFSERGHPTSFSDRSDQSNGRQMRWDRQENDSRANDFSPTMTRSTQSGHQSSSRVSNPNRSRAKICQFYAKGTCHFGTKCENRHIDVIREAERPTDYRPVQRGRKRLRSLSPPRSRRSPR